MNLCRRTATTLTLRQTILGITFTIAASKGFAAPLFWCAMFSFACAWFAQRRASTS